MATVFTMIINGDLPGHFVHTDDVCVAFLSINPITEGHTLVVPRAEVDQWTDLDAATAGHLLEVGHAIGNAQQAIWSPARIGAIIAGFEVPHTHLHVLPIDSMGDFDFAKAAPSVPADELAATALQITSELER